MSVKYFLKIFAQRGSCLVLLRKRHSRGGCRRAESERRRIDEMPETIPAQKELPAKTAWHERNAGLCQTAQPRGKSNHDSIRLLRNLPYDLTDAFRCACSDTLHGVLIVFNGKVILGTRARKTRTKSYEAFSSINYPYLAVLQDDCLLQYLENTFLPQPLFSDRLDERVALLKLIPGVRTALVQYMLRENNALILESVGVGGIPSYQGTQFLDVLNEGLDLGKTVVLTTQVANEGSNIGVYQVGRRLRACPQILEAFDMTTEVVVGKLMWILGQTTDPAQIRTLFYTPVAHDILNYK